MLPLQSSNISILKEVKFLCYWLSSLSLHKRIIFHYTYIANKFHFNYWSVSKTAETDASRPKPRLQVPRPRPKPQNIGLEWSRDQDHGLEDYKTGA